MTDDEPPPTERAPHEIERPTLVPCLVCDGTPVVRTERPDGRYSIAVCAWCTHGSMSAEQRRVWEARRRQP